MRGHWICQLSDLGAERIRQETGFHGQMPSTRVMMRQEAPLEQVRETALDIFVLHQIPPVTLERRQELLALLANDDCVSCHFVGWDQVSPDDVKGFIER
jgi:hypothetical protein